MTDSAPVLVWFRDDLRLADNPALHYAASLGRPVIPVFILDEESVEIRPLGHASRWWLHHSLESLGKDLKRLGSPLVLRRGPAETILPALVAESGATTILWNRRYGASRAIDQRLKEAFTASGREALSFQANLLFEPWSVVNQEGKPFQVFTPFWRACRNGDLPRLPLEAPGQIPSGPTLPSDSLSEWHLLPESPDWAQKLHGYWTPGEAGAMERLQTFMERGLALYHRRDEPGVEATSRLSPHLRFGEVSPFQIWAAAHAEKSPEAVKNRDKFLSEVGWREFSWSILFRHPDAARVNIKREFDHFPWTTPEDTVLRAWQKGTTGVPLVDAGMRELWETGYMHNRVRMVVASYLVKNLLIHWHFGEEWFWDTLVDADEANNPVSWQWVAGSGADAAPYFRVFNPLLQADKFDPERHYISRWAPDSGNLEPLVDLAESRDRALAAYQTMKDQRLAD